MNRSKWWRRLLRPPVQSREQLAHVLQQAGQQQLVDELTLSMMESALQFAELQVRDILIPRAQMVTLPNVDQLDVLLPLVINSAHSRFPVMGDNPDEVLGILLAKDLLGQVWSAKPFKLRNLLRPVMMVPESKRLHNLLQEFRSKHHHLTMVADEYGGIAGLVTIEDLLEQIVGDIEDEHDVDDEDFIKKRTENEFIVKALTPIEEFNTYFTTEFDEETVDTIGGLVLKTLGHLPKRGEKIVLGEFNFAILSADNRRIRLLRVWKNTL